MHIGKARTAARARGEARARALSDVELAAHLSEYADSVEGDTGRSYAPAFMREAAQRLAARVAAPTNK